tara:strand:- start:63 stop:329 length:267 start_codon:yes stop_codon:yes gene_type:complete
MQDFFDFLSWLGFTTLAAAVFGFSDVIGSTGLAGLELMTLGLCVSIAGGSGVFLLSRWVGRRTAYLSSGVGKSLSGRARVAASVLERT